MPQDFVIKAGDTLPPLEVSLAYESGRPVDLTGAQVTLVWKPKTGAGAAQRRAATITDTLNGRVVYEWQAGETSQVGFYFLEWEVLYGNGKLLTVPTHGFVTMEIAKSI